MSVNIDDLEFECTKFKRILQISICVVLSITTMGIILGVILFKYHWHIRWHWFRVKSRTLQSLRRNELSLISIAHNYTCCINYTGVCDK